ncbi:MAG TPA: copper chaperone PCu(A)C [Burkholderiales bacterium]|nr:copper chaperone PCu(A)C [Burkholderiales bacterium]
MKFLAAVLFFVLPLVAMPHSHEKGEIQVRHPWSRATPPGAKVAVGYMEIRNHGTQPDRLLSASTALAQRVEMHITRQEGEVVKMRQVKSFEVPARERYELRPGGAHLMLVDIARPLKKGERFAMKLVFERAGELEVEVEVQEQGARRPHH